MEFLDEDFGVGTEPAGLTSFGEHQVGSVTLTLEPVHASSPLDWVAAQFAAQPEALALPVERDEGVVGLVTRARVLERSQKFFDGLSNRSLDQDLAPHRDLSARQSVDQVVASLFQGGGSPLPDLFLVFLDGRYYGVTDLKRLVARSAQLREHDLAKAREVQEGSLARLRLPETRWQRSRLVRMAYGVGGDVYQELSWPDGTCVLGCFDVSGKGVSGSLVTAALGGFFGAVRTEGGPAPTLAALGRRLNEFLRECLPLGTFVTGVMFSLPARPGADTSLKVVNFGYSPVYFFVRKDQTMVGKGLKPNQPPLGLDALALDEAAVFRIPFEPGTKVYVFSDGMADLMSPSGQRYGEAQVREFIAKGYKDTAAEFLDRTRAEIEAWQGTAPQADDITMLTIHA